MSKRTEWAAKAIEEVVEALAALPPDKRCGVIRDMIVHHTQNGDKSRNYQRRRTEKIGLLAHEVLRSLRQAGQLVRS